MTPSELNELYEQAIGLLRQLISTPSFSREEQATANMIGGFLASKGIAYQRHLNNIWAVNKHFDKCKPTILLNSHHDTVRPSAQYTLSPFVPKEEEGKLYGLGSNDAGGCLVSLLATFLHLYDRKDMAYNLMLAATAEEEISGSNGIAAILPMLGKIDSAIVGEPTQMNMAVAEKGLLVLNCTAHGKAAHAANNNGDNAIYHAIDDINWFRTYDFDKVSDLLGPVKMSVTLIEAGTQHNIIPETCSYTVDCRINECYTHEEILDTIKSHIKSEVAPRSMRMRSTSIPLDHPLVKAGLQLDRSYYGSTTLSDKALMPFPALKMGPGDSVRSHMADEYIFTEEIREGIDIYIQLLNHIL